jgi:hypothetical protein
MEERDSYSLPIGGNFEMRLGGNFKVRLSGNADADTH